MMGVAQLLCIAKLIIPMSVLNVGEFKGLSTTLNYLLNFKLFVILFDI